MILLQKSLLLLARSVALMRFAAEAGDDGTARSRSKAAFLFILPRGCGSTRSLGSSPAQRFRALASQNQHLTDMTVRYHEMQLGQIQRTAACNALHDVGSRLSRWLLQTSDKTGEDIIPFTQEFLRQDAGRPSTCASPPTKSAPYRMLSVGEISTSWLQMFRGLGNGSAIVYRISDAVGAHRFPTDWRLTVRRVGREKRVSLMRSRNGAVGLLWVMGGGPGPRTHASAAPQ
jgi:hypothetical protein